jgi:hypothetical protein
MSTNPKKASRKNVVRVERLSGGIIKLHNTTASKSHFYSFNLGGKWDAAQKCWTLTSYNGTDAELQQECATAPYNERSSAAYWERRKKEEEAYQKSKQHYDAQLAAWERGEVPHDETSDWARDHAATASKYSRATDFERGVLICDHGYLPLLRKSVTAGYVIGKKDAVVEALYHAQNIDAHCISFKVNEDRTQPVVVDLPNGRAVSHYTVDYD